MSTRGFVGVRMNKKAEIFGHYNHSDSYPTGLGSDIVDAIECKSNNDIKTWFTKKYFIIEGLAREECYGEYHNFAKYLKENDTCFIRSGGEFYKDGLFCEWSYIFNIAEGTISIYKAFGTVPEEGIKDWNFENEHFIYTVGEFKYSEFTAELMGKVESFYRVGSNNGKVYKPVVETVKFVRFDYVSKEGVKSNRLVKVTSETTSSIVGVDLSKKGLRNFLKKNITNLKEVTI